MSTSNNSSSGGIGFIGLLTVAFIVLKLTGVITWSWWWVLAPAWIGLATILSVLVVFASVFAVFVIGVAIVKTITSIVRRNKNED